MLFTLQLLKNLYNLEQRKNIKNSKNPEKPFLSYKFISVTFTGFNRFFGGGGQCFLIGQCISLTKQKHFRTDPVDFTPGSIVANRVLWPMREGE